MVELKDMCLIEVPNILEPGNVIEWWKEAAKMNYDTIKKPCEEIMAANFRQISKQTDFLNLELPELQSYVINICNDNVDRDIILDAIMRWAGHEHERVTLLEDLLCKVELNKCSAEGIKVAMKTHDELLNKTLIVYKLLSNTLADIATATPMIAVVGGEDDDGKVSRECWEVNHPDKIVHLYDVPAEDLSICASICTFPQGFLITGGLDSRMCMMFIASSKVWARLQDLQVERCAHGSIYIKGVLYLLGGYLGKSTNGNWKQSDFLDSMAIKDKKWENGPKIPLAVQYPKLSNLGQNVYLLDEVTNQLLLFDVDKNVWKQLASLSKESKYCSGVSMITGRGKLLVAGGVNRVCAWYNADTNTWCTCQQPLQVHKYGALAYHNNKFLLLGGNFNGGTDEVEEYNIDENKWSMCSYKIPKKIHLHHALVLTMTSYD